MKFFKETTLRDTFNARFQMKMKLYCETMFTGPDYSFHNGTGKDDKYYI